MRFHDYYLFGYTVADHGETIQLRLVSSLSDGPKDESILSFTGVALYNFSHTEAAIIADVEEVPIDGLLTAKAGSIAIWSNWLGLRHWNGSLDAYGQKLNKDGYKAWEISSAIGFDGFVIAKSLT